MQAGCLTLFLFLLSVATPVYALPLKWVCTASAASFLYLVLTCSETEPPAKMGWAMSQLLSLQVRTVGETGVIGRTLGSKQQTPLLST